MGINLCLSAGWGMVDRNLLAAFWYLDMQIYEPLFTTSQKASVEYLLGEGKSLLWSSLKDLKFRVSLMNSSEL